MRLYLTPIYGKIHFEATNDHTVLKQSPFGVDNDGTTSKELEVVPVIGEPGQSMYVLALKPGTADSEICSSQNRSSGVVRCCHSTFLFQTGLLLVRIQFYSFQRLH